MGMFTKWMVMKRAIAIAIARARARAKRARRARRRARARARRRAVAIDSASPELKSFQVTSPPQSFKFVFSAECPIEETQNLSTDELPLGTVSFRVIEMPSNVLDDFLKVDISLYTPHHHGSCADPDRFRRVSFTEISKARMSANLICISRLAVVGSFMYALYLNLNGPHAFMSYNLSDGVMSSLPTPSPTPPEARSWRKVVTLGGKVYLLTGLAHLRSPKDHPFAEVFDPQTSKWSEIAQPPHHDATRISHGDFIVSLGETEGKLMVYHESREDGYPRKETEFMLYFYDVTKDKWRRKSCSGFAESCGLGAIMGKEVFNEDDGNLYWLSTDGLIYALDWKERRVYSCPIGGLEQVNMFRNLENSMGVSLHYLRSEFFCVVWCAHCSTKSDPRGGTEYHYTFLRVIKNSSTKTLNAVVLGCSVNSYDYRCEIFDAVRV